MISGLRARISGGDSVVGTFSLIPSVEVIELIALAGFDFVIVDMEHGVYDLGSARAALTAASANGLQAIVRVPRLESATIGAALDIGADGVLVPHVSCAEDALCAVRAARFTPDGSRGANPYVRGTAYGSVRDWHAQANERVAVMVMIEGREGIAAAREILSTPGLDAVFLGPVDLSHAMGLPGQPGHPQVISALEAVMQEAAAQGVASAVFAPDAGTAKTWLKHGVRLVACGVDTNLIRSGFTRTVRDIRDAPEVGE
jgi:4-hydroxy-2-oxoheptanedioate aldolase